jgi:choline monooxygenase
MSELPGRPKSSRPSGTCLPVSWYFDARVLELEWQLLFRQGPGYIGHELMVPRPGDYHTLAWKDHSQFLVRNRNAVELLSNVCRHRQAIMLQGSGNAQNIVCPVHHWTYDLQGELLGAPHFGDTPCLNLGATRLQNWQGLLFEGPREVGSDLAACSANRHFDFSGYLLDKIEFFEFKQNWKTFVEVYLEDYHVVPFHPGLGNFVDCDELRWEVSDTYSVQTVGINNHLATPGTPVYARWHEAVRAYRNNVDPDYGAIWMLYYPNVMLEWYPHCLVISTLVPRTPEHTTNVVEFYYPEDIVLFEREYAEAEQEAYRETSREDDEIAQRIDRGRRALMQRGEDDAGPYQSPMEDGMVHFHQYVRRALARHV